MSKQSKITTSHSEIRKWAEERDGRPAIVKGTNADHHSGTAAQNGGILRIDFPGGADQTSLESVSWNRFFEIFDQRQLRFLYQEELQDGAPSRFCKFIN
ncbi:MAG: hypothetical protein KDD42_02800 [Bdellovibrionales bacterium]|nr:hypothetical protein [Bdellovibrionales bacterium]